MELHTGDVNFTVDQIATFIRKLPSLRLLRNYKLVKTLHQLHYQDWKTTRDKFSMKYLLRNLDADFSYVVSRAF